MDFKRREGDIILKYLTIGCSLFSILCISGPTRHGMAQEWDWSWCHATPSIIGSYDSIQAFPQMYNNNKKALLSTALVLSAALDLSPILSPNPGIYSSRSEISAYGRLHHAIPSITVVSQITQLTNKDALLSHLISGGLKGTDQLDPISNQPLVLAITSCHLGEGVYFCS